MVIMYLLVFNQGQSATGNKEFFGLIVNFVIFSKASPVLSCGRLKPIMPSQHRSKKCSLLQGTEVKQMG